MPGEAGDARGAYTTITARLADAEAGEAAVERLQRAGIPPADSVLIAASGEAEDIYVRWPEKDRRLVYSVLRASLVGTWMGAVVGAVVGILLAALPPVRDTMGATVSLGTFAVAAVLGAIGGIFGGSLIGMTAGLDRTQAGSDPYDDQLAWEAAVIGVRTTDEEHIAIACAVLRECGATDIRIQRPDAGSGV